MEKYSRAAKNAILGDGMIRINKDTAAITYISTDLKLLAHKEKLLDLEGIEVTVKKTQASGYGGEKTIYVYSTTANEKVKEASDVGVEALIQDLTKEDIYLWYLDDGSWHINRNTMHLYSNMLDEEQSNSLIVKIGGMYGIEPRIRIDRKNDGRQFYYLYFPRDLVRLIRPEIKEYLTKNGIDTMMYKVGGVDYKESPITYTPVDQVKEIRKLYEEGEKSVKEIAEKYRFELSRVYRIVRYETYKDVI